PCIYPWLQKLCNAASFAVCLVAPRFHRFATHEVASEAVTYARLFLLWRRFLTFLGNLFLLLSIPINRNAGVRRSVVCRR
ncbi:MAG: hypothetical protein ACREEY_13600, partial [Brevundimonas sp.]